MDDMAGLRNVLIVEDDALIRELYRTTLVEFGYRVEVAGDSKETFAKIPKFHPDVILLDIMLPDQSGLDILKDLRTKPEHHSQDTKVVLLTNLAQKNLADTAIEYGADGYIIKADILPRDLDEIIKSLEASKEPAKPTDD